MRLGESIPASVLGAPPLVLDYLAVKPGLEGFFHPFPSGLEAFAKLRHPDPLSPEERRSLARALLPYQERFGASAATLRNAERLGKPAAIAIVTGQQPGFLVGPLYTLLKAATAVRLALDLEGLGVPAVPVFWNHSEDHDLEEANHLDLPDSDYELRRLRLPYAPERRPLSEVRLDGRAEELFRAALALLPESEFRPSLEELFRPRPGRSLSEEATRILLSLFAEQGLVVVEPDQLRAWSHQPLVRLLQSGERWEAALAQTRDRLRKGGYEPVIAEDQALLFERVGERRLRIQRKGKEWGLPSGKPLSSAQLAEEIARDPSRFSPGALLRPLGQSRAIPAAAYVGGPTEIAYSAENFGLFSMAGLEAPVLLPRFSATFVEPSTAKLLEKLGLQPREALAPEGEVRRRFPAVEGRAGAEVASLESELARRLEGLEAEIRDLDPTLLEPLRKTGESAAASLRRLREKLSRAARSRAGAGERRLHKLSALLFPRGLPQERVLSPLYFLARHGTAFVRELVGIASPFERDHRIVYLSSVKDADAHGS